MVIQFTMMNNQRQWSIGVLNSAPNIPYSISGNVITIYTRNMPVTPESVTSGMISSGNGTGSAANGGHNLLMTNPLCMSEALTSFHQTLRDLLGILHAIHMQE